VGASLKAANGQGGNAEHAQNLLRELRTSSSSNPTITLPSRTLR
jgi:hypothetical protein